MYPLHMFIDRFPPGLSKCDEEEMLELLTGNHIVGMPIKPTVFPLIPTRMCTDTLMKERPAKFMVQTTDYLNEGSINLLAGSFDIRLVHCDSNGVIKGIIFEDVFFYPGPINNSVQTLILGRVKGREVIQPVCEDPGLWDPLVKHVHQLCISSDMHQ